MSSQHQDFQPYEAALLEADLVLKPLSEVRDDISDAIRDADNIWLLTRNGQSWQRIFKKVLILYLNLKPLIRKLRRKIGF
uniref:Uncharacterized protein n=1 Tax=Candidatus Kentrum sp. MB TaxID=2138164 RepID=A0A450XS55_9GAMM|nr:MAG: hypothetical protein BECKMB1821G_GA0114241_11027 [Candidatus Kentron sp. MB]